MLNDKLKIIRNNRLNQNYISEKEMYFKYTGSTPSMIGSNATLECGVSFVAGTDVIENELKVYDMSGPLRWAEGTVYQKTYDDSIKHAFLLDTSGFVTYYCSWRYGSSLTSIKKENSIVKNLNITVYGEKL